MRHGGDSDNHHSLNFTDSTHPKMANAAPPNIPRMVMMKTPNLTGRQQQKVRVGARAVVMVEESMSLMFVEFFVKGRELL
jgi:hypothetical protein